jgi:hypothetical protein
MKMMPTFLFLPLFVKKFHPKMKGRGAKSYPSLPLSHNMALEKAFVIFRGGWRISGSAGGKTKENKAKAFLPIFYFIISPCRFPELKYA